MDRIVIDLDRADLNVVIQPDIETAAECTGKAGIRKAVISETRRTRRAGRCRTRQFREFRTSMRGADQSMCERFPCTAVGIVLDLNAAEKVVQRVAVLYVNGNRWRSRDAFIKPRAVKMRREITLNAEIAAKVVHSANLESVKVFAFAVK